MDLPPSSRLPLPLELNCEIFKCLKLPIQRKFICGMGRDIYEIFGQKILSKTKRHCIPKGGNGWKIKPTWAEIVRGGFNASNYQCTLFKPHNFYNLTASTSLVRWPHLGSHILYTTVNNWAIILAVKGFTISVEHHRKNGFPGTILYYYEIKCEVGLSDGIIPTSASLGSYPNSYATDMSLRYPDCRLDGVTHLFEFTEGAIRPKLKYNGNVFGCGLVLGPNDKWAIFFTLNGILFGRQLVINPTVDCLFPAVTVWDGSSLEANFGNDLMTKPFEYDTKNCPGMELACI